RARALDDDTLFAVLIAVLVIFGLTQIFGKKPGSDLYVMSSMHNPKVEIKDINGVIIERTRPKAEKLVFAKSDEDQWRLLEPFPAEVETSSVENLIRQVMDARREENADLTSDLKK